jgi:RHS repeat-associated protein
MARYYQGNSGRFATADPGGIKAAVPGNPMSWNRMMYAGGDPVNFLIRGGD